MNPISYLTPQDYTIMLIIMGIHVLLYLYYQKRMQQYVSLTTKNVKENAHLYTSEIRAFIEKIVEQCGVTAQITPISGLRAGKKEESLSFAVLPGMDGVFYLNIPLGWISFLRDVLKKMNAHETPSAEESQKLNGFVWVMHHEMNHVKKIVARRSVFSQSMLSKSYQRKIVLLSMIFQMVLCIYIAHLGLSLSSEYVPSILIGGSIGFMVGVIGVVSRRCREEYACDVQGIENIPVLRGGIDWLLRDAEAYVDGLFNGPLRLLRPLYTLFPNALCSFFTLHPHPIARAAAIEKKIAMLEGRG